MLGVGVGSARNLFGAPVLKNDYQQGVIPLGIATHACVEGKVGEGTVTQQTGFVPRDPVTDLGINLRSRAFQRIEIVEVGYTSRVLRPGQELLARDDPN